MYGLGMALICPRCESKDPKDFYIVQGKVNRGFANQPGGDGPMLGMSYVPDKPTCKNCDVALVEENKLIENKQKLLREQNPEEMAKYMAEQRAQLPGAILTILGFIAMCVFLWWVITL